MIDPEVFAFEIGVLEEQFGASFQGPAGTERCDRYYAYCSEHLTTQQFVLAAHVIFAEDDRFPKPKRFVEAAQANLEEQAVSEWVRLTVAAQHITRTQTEGLSQAQLCPGLSLNAQFALESIGGLHVVADADLVNQLSFLRRDFLVAHKAFANQATQQSHTDRLLTGSTQALLAPAEPAPQPALLKDLPLEHQEAQREQISAIAAKHSVQPFRQRLEEPEGEAPDDEYFRDFGLFQRFVADYQSATDPDLQDAAVTNLRSLADTGHKAVQRFARKWLSEHLGLETDAKKHGEIHVDFANIGRNMT